MKADYTKDSYGSLLHRIRAIELKKAKLKSDYMDKLAKLGEEIDVVFKEIHRRDLKKGRTPYPRTSAYLRNERE